MRAQVVLALSLFLAPLGLVACDEDVVAQDMAMATDMAATDDTCDEITACVAGCAGNAACQGACIAAGTAMAQDTFAALFGCAYGQCSTTPAGDGGATDGGGAVASCASTTDGTPDCQACLNTAGLSAACSSQLAACQIGN